MTDEGEESGVSRRHVLFLTGTTTAATAGAVWWSWPHLKSILGGRSESPERREIPRHGNGDDGVTPEPEPGDRYQTWQDAVPEGCDISAYEDEVEAYVRDDLGMEDDLTEYVNSGRIEFRAESDGELLLLADTNGSGQYDTDDYLPNVCG